MNIRVVRKSHGFTAVDNALLNASTISFQAKGLLCYLLSKTDDWRAIVSQLCGVGPDGETAIRNTMAELIQSGYARRVRIVDPKSKQLIRWEFVVYENPADAEALPNKATVDQSTKEATSRKPTNGLPTRGKHPTTKDYNNEKTEGTKEVVSSCEDTTGHAVAMPDKSLPADASEEEDLRIARQLEGRGEENAEGSATEQGSLELKSEDETAKDFPWPGVMRIFSRVCPHLASAKDKGPRRDAAMKRFWRENGKSLGAFEALAAKVAESDYLMGRNGHTGQVGKPYPLSWIFSKTEKGEVRAEKILRGEYSTEAMAFVLEKAKEAKLTRVWNVGQGRADEVDLGEMIGDKPRWMASGSNHIGTGLPEMIDLKP